MRDIWLNPSRTSNWDSDPLSGNPLRGEQVDLLLSLIADHFTPGSTILDIGSGSGLVEEQLFQRVPEASVVGVDYSPAMIAMAVKRLAGREKQFEIGRASCRERGERWEVEVRRKKKIQENIAVGRG